jgi:hypothetical protein
MPPSTRPLPPSHISPARLLVVVARDPSREGRSQGAMEGGVRERGRTGERRREGQRDREREGREGGPLAPRLTSRARQSLGTTMPSQCALLAWL